MVDSNLTGLRPISASLDGMRQISTRVDENLWREVRAIAQVRRITLQRLISEALLDWVEKHRNGGYVEVEPPATASISVIPTPATPPAAPEPTDFELPIGDHWITPRQAASYLGVTYDTVRKLIVANRLRASRQGGRWLVSWPHTVATRFLREVRELNRLRFLLDPDPALAVSENPTQIAPPTGFWREKVENDVTDLVTRMDFPTYYAIAGRFPRLLSPGAVAQYEIVAEFWLKFGRFPPRAD